MKRLLAVLMLLTVLSGCRSARPVKKPPAPTSPKVTVTIDAPTNVTVKVVLTNSVSILPPVTNRCDQAYNLVTCSGTNGIINVYRVEARVKRLIASVQQ